MSEKSCTSYTVVLQLLVFLVVNWWRFVFRFWPIVHVNIPFACVADRWNSEVDCQQKSGLCSSFRQFGRGMRWRTFSDKQVHYPLYSMTDMTCDWIYPLIISNDTLSDLKGDLDIECIVDMYYMWSYELMWISL